MFLYWAFWQDLPLLSDKKVYGEDTVSLGDLSPFETTVAEMGECTCACGESVIFLFYFFFFVFKILNLLFALSPTELAAWIASGPSISVWSLVIRNWAYLFDFMLVLLICFSAVWSAEWRAVWGKQWHKAQFLQWFDFWLINSGLHK